MEAMLPKHGPTPTPEAQDRRPGESGARTPYWRALQSKCSAGWLTSMPLTSARLATHISESV